MHNSLARLFLRTSSIVPSAIYRRLEGFQMSLAKASMRIGLRTYVGMTVFVTLASFLAAFTATYAFQWLLRITVANQFLWPAIVALITGFGAFIFMYAFPKYVASNRGRKIDADLPTIANFLSVLASSGMPPEEAFKALARVAKHFNVTEETKSMMRDIEIMGIDLHTALKSASERSPSQKFAQMLDGVASTSHSGGDLAGYLRDQADKYKRARTQGMRQFVENLSVIAEVYVTFMVAAPIMMIVMLSVMAFIGGGIVLGNLEPRVLMDILTYVITPVGIIVLILAVDMVTPPR